MYFYIYIYINVYKKFTQSSFRSEIGVKLNQSNTINKVRNKNKLQKISDLILKFERKSNNYFF